MAAMSAAPPAVSASALARARELHAKSVVLDAHVDTLSEMLERNYDLGSAPDSAHLSWPLLAEGGLSAQIFACFVSPRFLPDRCAAHVDKLIDRFEAEVARFPERLAPCRSAADVDAALGKGRLAGILSIEGGHAIEDSLDTLRHFHARGVRAMTLTWNNTNNWADGCGPMDPRLPRHGGLTDFGREVVATMEEIGMAVDISHVSPDTFGQVLEIATRSPFASHSSCRALNDHRRNLADDQMRGLAERGGVLGICFCSGFLIDESRAWAKAKSTADYAAITNRTNAMDFAGITDEEYRVYNRHVPLAVLEDAVRHVDHALRVMGTEGVGLGSDFDGARRFPVGLDNVGKLPYLTARLLEIGWKESELTGLLGRNLLEYFRRVIG
jgi:membrane dipeptidase